MNLVIRNGPSTRVIKNTSFVKIKVNTCVASYPARAEGTKIDGENIFLTKLKNKWSHICYHRC
jgi:hypothetical protein